MHRATACNRGLPVLPGRTSSDTRSLQRQRGKPIQHSVSAQARGGCWRGAHLGGLAVCARGYEAEREPRLGVLQAQGLLVLRYQADSHRQRRPRSHGVHRQGLLVDADTDDGIARPHLHRQGSLQRLQRDRTNLAHATECTQQSGTTLQCMVQPPSVWSCSLHGWIADALRGSPMTQPPGRSCISQTK